MIFFVCALFYDVLLFKQKPQRTFKNQKKGSITELHAWKRNVNLCFLWRNISHQNRAQQAGRSIQYKLQHLNYVTFQNIFCHYYKVRAVWQIPSMLSSFNNNRDFHFQKCNSAINFFYLLALVHAWEHACIWASSPLHQRWRCSGSLCWVRESRAQDGSSVVRTPPRSFLLTCTQQHQTCLPRVLHLSPGRVSFLPAFWEKAFCNASVKRYNCSNYVC